MNTKTGYVGALAAAALLSMVVAIGFMIRCSPAKESANRDQILAYILMPAAPFMVMAFR